ncbi:MAG: metallophosphoesterase [Odoribacteraceae bacterium]|jgi:predicted MPP superfamily phosphohydrolase|nr:metallophosphoesterase [Odoribacteraceae bacterium]
MRILPVIFVLLLYLSGNFYIFHRLWQLLPWHHPLVGGGFIVGGLFLASAIFLSFLLQDLLPAWLTGRLYVVGTTWVFVFLYLLMANGVRDLFLWVDGRWHLLPLSWSTGEGFRWITYVVATGVAAAVLVGGHVRYCIKERVEWSVDTGKIAGESVKIVVISDLHLGYGIGRRELARWVELINAERPDVVLIAGDMVDHDIRPLEEQRLWEGLRRIEARWGVYACPGNHEYIAGIDKSLRFLEKAGIRVLRDSVVEVGGAFLLAGRDDRQNPGRASLRKLIGGLERSKPLLLLDHQPVHLEEAVEQGVDLQFSGHTHRGQVWPVNWITDRLFEVSHGYKRKGNTRVYVTSGIGLWGGKFRIGTRSEYLVIRLQ